MEVLIDGDFILDFEGVQVLIILPGESSLVKERMPEGAFQLQLLVLDAHLHLLRDVHRKVPSEAELVWQDNILKGLNQLYHVGEVLD